MDAIQADLPAAGHAPPSGEPGTGKKSFVKKP
ncbi:hypothetical protein X732_17540 [Mesorhizobium sp. L2C066B000]|nr:hypothetical protein X732_17540 [Mesorhizobium sp. L2C066B000]